MDDIYDFLIRKNISCVILISPFRKHVENGVTWRISYINNKFSLGETFTVYKYFRSSRDLFRFSVSDDIIEGTSNKYLNLFYIPLILKIFFLSRKQKICLYCHTLWSGLYGLFFKFFLGIPYIFDDHNVEHDRFTSYNKFLGFIIHPFEYLLIKFSNFNVLSSESDIFRIQQLYGVNRSLLISNSFVPIPSLKVDRDSIFEPLGLDSNKKILLFFGSFDYAPNIEAANFIANTIAPFFSEKNYLFVIAGKCSQNLKISAENVILLGFVDNIDGLISAADLIIAPIFSGGGVKIKILHSIALGKKIVTTLEGVRGIDFNPQQVFVSEKENFCHTIETNL